MFERPRYYRLDGSAYPNTDEGMMEWARDLEDIKGRIVRQETLWNGIWLSTVFLGLDHRWGDGPPLIFETMAFNKLMPDHFEPYPIEGAMTLPYREFTPDIGIQERYSTLQEAEAGHYYWKKELSGVKWTIRMFMERLEHEWNKN